MSGLGTRTDALETFEAVVAALAHAMGVTRVVATDRAVRAVEFGLVGVSGAGVNAAIFLALVRRGAYLVPGLLAFWFAVAWTFGLNWVVTFADTHDRLLRRFARYVAVSSLGYVIYTTVLSTAIEAVRLTYPLAVAAAIGVAGTWNFLGAERFAMARRE